MRGAELRTIADALPTPLVAEPATPPAGSTVVRATWCTCTGERPSAGFCPACHFVADWVPAEYAAAFVAIANHGPALVGLLEACERWRAAIDERRRYGESVYRGNPFDLCSEPFRVESARLDRAIVDQQRDVLAALADVHAVGASLESMGER